MNKHTPGPWTIGDENNAGCEVLAGPVAIVLDRTERTAGDGTYVISRDEMLANARLIAAAPDMLEALEHAESLIADLCRYSSGHRTDLAHIRSAIKKARRQAAR